MNSGYPELQFGISGIVISDIRNCNFGYPEFEMNSGYPKFEFGISEIIISDIPNCNSRYPKL
jgi:hypothetical protein